jgi:hypothetical protein
MDRRSGLGIKVIPTVCAWLYTGNGVKTMPGHAKRLEQKAWIEAESQLLIAAAVQRE